VAKRTIVIFVRDRLEADYNIYIRTKEAKGIRLVKLSEVNIFDILKEHHPKRSEKNNWY
jgi:hypothetical protein